MARLAPMPSEVRRVSANSGAIRMPISLARMGRFRIILRPLARGSAAGGSTVGWRRTRAAGGRVAGVADRQVPMEGGQRRLVEYLTHQSHVPEREQTPAVGDAHPGPTPDHGAGARGARRTRG